MEDLEPRMAIRRCLDPGADTYSDLAVALHDVYLDVLGTSLNDLEQALDGQFDCLIPSHVVFMVLLQELTDSLRRAANGVCL